MLANGIRWEAQGWSPSSIEEQESSHIEKFLAGVFHVNSLREEKDLAYEFFLQLVRDGASVIYTVWDPELVKKYKTTFDVPDEDNEAGVETVNGYSEAPVHMEIIDPLKIFVLPGGPNRWQIIFREEDRSVHDVEREYGVKITEFGHLDDLQKLTQKGKFIDFWEWAVVSEEVVTEEIDEEGNHIVQTNIKEVVRNGILFNTQTIKKVEEMPGYNYLPYTIGFYKPIGSKKSDEWGHSIIRPLETSVVEVEKSINRRSRQINTYSSLPPIAKARPGRPISVDAALGTLITLGVDEDFGFPVWPGNAPDVNMHIDFFRERTQQSGFADVLMGMGSGAASGYAISQLGDQNRIRLAQPLVHGELALSLWAKKLLSMTTEFASNEMVRVYGKVRGQSFFDHIIAEGFDQFLVNAKIKPEFPNERARNHAMGNQVRDVLSQDTIMETYLGIDQPDEERRKRISNKIEEHPAMINYVVARELQGIILGAKDPAQKEAAMIALESLTNPQPEEAGVGREQTPGMASSTGELTDQEGGLAPSGQDINDQVEAEANAGIGMV